MPTDCVTTRSGLVASPAEDDSGGLTFGLAPPPGHMRPQGLAPPPGHMRPQGRATQAETVLSRCRSPSRACLTFGLAPPPGHMRPQARATPADTGLTRRPPASAHTPVGHG